MSKFGRRIKTAPPGFEYVEETLNALDMECREKVNEPHEGLRKTESQWPVFQINWQKTRYVYDLYYTYQAISREVYDYCIKNKIVDAALIAKWKKNGYERLCSTYTINPRNYKFGTVSICRVPKHFLPPGSEIEDPTTGCRGCASGSGGKRNIFGNKYGQYLAAVQIARENRNKGQNIEEHSEEEDVDENNEEIITHVDNIDGSSAKVRKSIWAANIEEELSIELPENSMGEDDISGLNETKAAIESYKKIHQSDRDSTQASKKSRSS